MEAYKFTTTILPTGIIKIPLEYQIFNSEVEVVLLVNKQKGDIKKINQNDIVTPTDFYTKWAGIIENENIGDWKNDRIDYLKHKHQ